MCKTCNKCKITYDDVESNFRKKLKSFCGICKKCMVERDIKYRENIKETRAEYYKNNKEKISEHNRKYRENNKEKMLARERKYRENSRRSKYFKKHYENNKEKCIQYIRVSYLLRTASLNRKDVTPDVVGAVETIIKTKKTIKTSKQLNFL